MKVTLTLLGAVAEQMAIQFDQARPNEGAGYLFVRVGLSEFETRLIGREFWPIQDDELLEKLPHHLSIKSASYTRAFRHADETKQGFWFVHSHPKGFTSFSRADDATEPPLFESAHVRIENLIPHGSLVFPLGGSPIGRVWQKDGSVIPVNRIRVVGRRLTIYDAEIDSVEIPPFFDRQVRAFGPDVQKLLARLHVGVVGCGGTGSAVCQQLIRLGVGTLSIFDGQRFEGTNVNRVYGSLLSDDGAWKTNIVEREAASIGLGTVIKRYNGSIYQRDIARRLIEPDVLFGCTDEEYGRSILNDVSLRYGIPLFDMGVKIVSENGMIDTVVGRITTVQPGNACLLCRRRITPRRIAAEALRAVDPDKAKQLAAEGYAPELETPAPAVITFTSPVAAAAVNEFLHRLTGFMGPDRETTEVLHFFDQCDIGRNATAPEPTCKCAAPKVLGSGDVNPFLGMTWSL
jgi:molybdopterin/thiamine biosynthesis adenylyltransferase